MGKLALYFVVADFEAEDGEGTNRYDDVDDGMDDGMDDGVDDGVDDEGMGGLIDYI